MDWNTTATQILTAATGAGVAVERALIAPGPRFARDCRMIAVWLETVQIVPLAGNEFASALCAFATQLRYQVTFVADCVPAADDQANPPKADEITKWSNRFLADQQKIHEALTTLAVSDTIGSCHDVQIGDANPDGPEGMIAEVSFPVTVLIST